MIVQRHIINLCTKDTLPKLIATLDVSSKFDIIAWLKANTDYERKEVRVHSMYTYNDSIIDSKKVYEILNILNIRKE